MTNIMLRPPPPDPRGARSSKYGEADLGIGVTDTHDCINMSLLDMEISSADGGLGHAKNDIGWLYDLRPRTLLQAQLSAALVDKCLHG